MSGRVAAFRVDATPEIGGGHGVRCATLARALADAGFRPLFYVNDGFRSVVPAPLVAGIELREPDRASTFAAQLSAEFPAGVDLLVVDHYGLSAAEEAPAAALARCTLIIDDLADRSHQCDILLDQTVGRVADAYRGLVPTSCRMLIGGEYSLLREEFARLRPAALARRAQARADVRLLITMGLTDVGGITADLVARIGADHPFDAIDVVLSPAAPSWAPVAELAARDSRVTVHTAGRFDVAELMASATLAIGAAGTTSWERCCLGLPTVILQLAANQTVVVRELAAAGAAVIATSPADAARQAVLLAADASACRAMSARAAALIDGRGADRVVSAIAEHLEMHA